MKTRGMFCSTVERLRKYTLDGAMTLVQVRLTFVIRTGSRRSNAVLTGRRKLGCYENVTLLLAFTTIMMSTEINYLLVAKDATTAPLVLPALLHGQSMTRISHDR